LSGLNTKIADLDTQQGTLSNWHRNRLNRGLNPIGSVEVFRSASDALGYADVFDLLLLDGAPRASAATLEIARVADLVIQPTGASLDDLDPAILLFHELVKAGVSRNRLVFALARIGTDTESQEAAAYIEEAGYRVFDEVLFERPSYRQAQNNGLAVTETRYKSLNLRAEKLIQAITERLVNG
jgi:chromosome partitioning protein